MTFSRLRDVAAKTALALGAAGLIAAPLAAWILPAAFGRTVTILVTPNEAAIVELNRGMWTAGEPVAAIYGTPIGEPKRILFADDARIIVPREDPSLNLYVVDKNKGQNPLQMQTVRFFATFGMIGSGILLLAGILHFAWKRLRRR